MRKTNVSFLLALCLLHLTVATASAFGEIRYPDRPLNLRAARSATARWVGNLHPGQKIRVAFMKDGWVAIFEPGETRADESLAAGYANASFLLPKPTRVESNTWGELMVAPRRLNIRSSASISSTLVGKLEAMELVKIDFPEDGWVMVFHPDATIRSQMNARGYCATRYLNLITALTQEAPVQEGRLGADVTMAENDLPSESRGVDLRGTAIQPTDAAVVVAQHDLAASSDDFGKDAASPKSAPIAAETALAQPVVILEPDKQTLVINRTRFEGSKRTDPSPDKTAHGYQYRLLEKSEIKKNGVTWITLKVFLSTTKLPDSTQLKDFCTTLWNEHRRVTRNLKVLVYLPEMNTDDLAYGVASFDDKTLLELYVRRVTLFGTKFL